MMKKIILGTFLCLFTSTAVAHPVIWKDGKALSIKSDDYATHARFMYSLDYDWALGLHQMNLESGDRYTIAQSNWLLQRWNGVESQGNLYAGIGYGLENEASDSLLHASLQADWETRRYYTLIRADYYGFDDSLLALQGRLGIAPYVGNFEDTHMWLILQLDDQIIDNEHDTSLMPVIRLFKDNILLEYGNDFDGKQMIIAMYHF